MRGSEAVDVQDAATELGRVIASHGRHVLVESAQGERISCTLLGRRLEAVCGDEVRWRTSDSAGRGVVFERKPRRTALTRSSGTGASEVVVANITQLVVVFAPLPEPDFFIVDRYLAAAELSGLEALVVLNKVELADTGDACQAELAAYGRIGYTNLACSAASGTGVPALHEALRANVTVVVGQSGVGKSSLANCLLPGLDAETAELTRSTVEGRHITSVATLHHLPGGGDLIDSPGVRDYAPGIELLGDPVRAFREFAVPAADCRFKDCRHLREPDCKVRQAVDTGLIAPRRYESYRRLLRLQTTLGEKRTRKERR